MKATALNTHVIHKVLKQQKLPAKIVITFQVMTFSGMSPGYPDAVSTLPYGGQSKRGAHSAGAGDSYHPDIGRIFHPVDARKISGAITTPVAQKGYDFWFPICHFYIDSPLSYKISMRFYKMLHYDESYRMSNSKLAFFIGH